MEEENITLAMTHGHSDLYRNRFGFSTFTYNQGVFATPAEIEERFGFSEKEESLGHFQTIENRYVHNDLLVVINIKVRTREDCKQVLQKAAALARDRGKARILFEYPFSSEHESVWPFCRSIDSPFLQMAELCGAHTLRQSASPDGPVSHGDWVKLLRPYEFLEAVLGLAEHLDECVTGSANIIVDSLPVSIECTNDGIRVSDEQLANADELECTSTDLVRLVTGYHSISELAVINDCDLTEETLLFLDQLFPKTWRFSRNEDWIYTDSSLES
jgi:hypothetical protein